MNCIVLFVMLPAKTMYYSVLFKAVNFFLITQISSMTSQHENCGKEDKRHVNMLNTNLFLMLVLFARCVEQSVSRGESS